MASFNAEDASGHAELVCKMSVVNKPWFFSHAIRTELHSTINVLSVCVCKEWVFGGQDKTVMHSTLYLPDLDFC